MATLKEKIMVEAQVRELLARNGLPEPDEVEYGYTCIRLYFNEPKTVLIVDIDEPPQDDPARKAHDDYFVEVEDVDEDLAIPPISGSRDDGGAQMN